LTDFHNFLTGTLSEQLQTSFVANESLHEFSVSTPDVFGGSRAPRIPP